MMVDDLKALTVADTEGTGGYIRDRVKDDQTVVLPHVVRVSTVATCDNATVSGLPKIRNSGYVQKDSLR